MKGGDMPGITATAPPVNGNGTHRKEKRNGPRRKTPTNIAEEPEVAESPFVELGAEAVDLPMWVLQPAGWYQPDLAPAPPSWSGLAVERRGRVPVPDFVRAEPSPFEIAAAPAGTLEAITPNPQPQFPDDDLTPLGWDPRAHCPKGEGK